jgi:hypothetical protein
MPDDDKPMMTESTKRELEAMGIKGPFFLNGKEVEVVPDGEAREMLVICMTSDSPRYFKDDVEGTCADCGVAIHHRPHIPFGAITICQFCYLKRSVEDKTSEGIPDVFKKWTD